MCIWGVGGREALEGRDICIYRADSYCCTTEINTTLYSNYPPIKIFKCAYEHRYVHMNTEALKKVWMVSLG